MTGASESAERSLVGREQQQPQSRARRKVATRVLASYAIVTLAVTAVAGWAVAALRSSAREAVMMSTGYLPLAVSFRDVVASQDIYNTQLNHVTAAKNPADQRVWFDMMLHGGRAKTFGELREALTRAFELEPRLHDVEAELLAETTAIERFLDGDRDLLPRLFDALNAGDAERAEQQRNELVTRGHQARKRLSVLEQRVERLVDSLIAEAHARERWALGFLVALAVFTVLVGIGMALYARRVLAPLAVVTARAKAVASGDLTPHEVPASNDEIGELSRTFEAMVSAIARANAELVAAERLGTIGKMAAHVTHEIRNPLSSLALNVELLEEEIGESGEARALLRAIKGEVDRLTALSERYLSVARRKPPRMESEDIGEICREAADFVRPELERHRIKLALELEGELPAVSVDEGQIRQALYNLLRNAREAMPDGGVVTVSARRAVDGGVDVAVDDEGGGIDAETREHIFEPFFTTKGHGTGLGLVITREVIEAHGGTIHCEPREPRGTRFAIHLPAAA